MRNAAVSLLFVGVVELDAEMLVERIPGGARRVVPLVVARLPRIRREVIAARPYTETIRKFAAGRHIRTFAAPAVGMAGHILGTEPAPFAVIGHSHPVAVPDAVVVVIVDMDLVHEAEPAHVIAGDTQIFQRKDHHAGVEILEVVIIEPVDPVSVEDTHMITEKRKTAPQLEDIAIELQSDLPPHRTDARDVLVTPTDKAPDQQRIVDHLQVQRMAFRVFQRQRRLELPELDAELRDNRIFEPTIQQLGRIRQLSFDFVLQPAEIGTLIQFAPHGQTRPFDIKRIVNPFVEIGLETVSRLEVSGRVEILHPRLFLRRGRKANEGCGKQRQKESSRAFHGLIGIFS